LFVLIALSAVANRVHIVRATHKAVAGGRWRGVGSGWFEGYSYSYGVQGVGEGYRLVSLQLPIVGELNS
jgi:hypothetical protein